MSSSLLEELRSYLIRLDEWLLGFDGTTPLDHKIDRRISPLLSSALRVSYRLLDAARNGMAITLARAGSTDSVTICQLDVFGNANSRYPPKGSLERLRSSRLLSLSFSSFRCWSSVSCCRILNRRRARRSFNL